ncbi:WecB/TagA/CpsF family glycosyltransferase [Porphyrobacter algicida]|uniref:WecB/TagA/CpsF family glycosyltransferase n=1 Tax=Qipengyuania algicida TaxID=1836209 RepID=A0A845AIK0_9SPHN|nr:WecB/TagA/CpsF family glycosyltransferase [Qipengyuania algicida]
MSEGAAEPLTFLNIAFSQLTLDQAVEWVERHAHEDSFTYVVTPNVDHVVMYHGKGDEPWRTAYRQAVVESDLRLNDSRILAKLAKLSGESLRIAPGSDLVKQLIGRLGGKNRSLALVGGQVREADWLRHNLPNCAIKHLDPPMGVRDSALAREEITHFVEAARADIVLFAIGAPQSEIVAREIAQRGKARGVALCIGASVEFLSGAKRRAPLIMQKIGLEWLFRLASEPTRLWQRYLVKGPRIFAIWWADRQTSRRR